MFVMKFGAGEIDLKPGAVFTMNRYKAMFLSCLYFIRLCCSSSLFVLLCVHVECLFVLMSSDLRSCVMLACSDASTTSIAYSAASSTNIACSDASITVT